MINIFLLLKGDIALDDTKIFAGECETPDFVTISCDFEDDHICGYQPDVAADFRWIRNRGPTETEFTGPSFDVCLFI